MLQCDWCHKPIGDEGAKGWAYQLKLAPFHSLNLGRTIAGSPALIDLLTHLHQKPCKDELGWAIAAMLKDREPLETDGPSEEAEEEEEEVEESSHGRPLDQFKRGAEWRRMPMAERERVALNVLGDDRLTIRELAERMHAELPECEFHETHVRTLVTRLFRARDLDRKGENWMGKVRYRYFARRELDGPIADLERTFNEGEEA